MDIRNHKSLLHEKIKRLALKTTTTAILALNAEVLSAASCPLYITTDIPGVCDFNTNSSVTVANGGSVGGIDMVNYNPAAPSFIAIDAGGLINNTAGTGITIVSSSLSNGISNGGTVSGTNFGLLLTTSTISGGISNSGTIASSSTGIAVGSASTVNGGIVNSGTIQGVNQAIELRGRLNGGLTNSGTISSSASGVTLRSATLNGGISNRGTLSTHNVSIGLFSSFMNDDIVNMGTIHAPGGTGVLLQGSTLAGNIANGGTILVGGDFNGIVLNVHTTMAGNISNSGLISATGDGNGIIINSTNMTGEISNSGTIQSAAGSGVAINISSHINGNISNSGTISGHLNGLAIHNGSSLSGNVTNTGTLSGGTGTRVGGLSIYSSATVHSVVNSGTIKSNTHGIFVGSAATISGSITNSGTIKGNTHGIFVGSATTISGGITNSGTIQGDTFAIQVTPGSTVNSIDITGQSARIIGAVEAIGTTVNITDGAIFTSEGAYLVNQFNIDSNALFNMANLIAASSVNNAGTLAVGQAERFIIGNYAQQTGGTFNLGVLDASHYGQLRISGTADLSQSGAIYVQVDQNAGLHNGDTLTNVIRGSTLVTPTDGFHVSDNSFIWTFIPELNADNGVNLLTSINPAAYNVCQGTYCQGAAGAILGQIAAGNLVFAPYNVLPTASAFREAASQATPELTNENMQVTQLITRAVTDVAPMWSSLHGQSAGDAMLYQPGKIWVKPYGGSMTQNARNTVQGFNAHAYGAVIGKDIQLSDDWLVGGGAAAGGDSMRGKSVLHTQSIESSAYQGMLYGAKRYPNQVYVAGQGLIGYENNDTSRFIPLYASTAKGSFNSWFTNLRAEAGWSTYVGSPHFVLTPSVDASYLYIRQGGYQETGSLMDLSVASNNISSLVLGAYANGAYHLPTTHYYGATLTGYAGLAGDVINTQPQVLSTFVAGGAGFSTFGVQWNGLVFRGGAGLMLTSATQPLTVQFNYDLQAGNNAYSGVGSATIKYKA